jgi:hypothetical protein
MGRAYSERFAIMRDGGSINYVVPVGQRAVVKYVASRNTATGGGEVMIDVGGSTVWSRSVPGATTLSDDGLMLVAYEGEQIRLTNSQLGMRSVICGYLLAAS